MNKPPTIQFERLPKAGPTHSFRVDGAYAFNVPLVPGVRNLTGALLTEGTNTIYGPYTITGDRITNSQFYQVQSYLLSDP